MQISFDEFLEKTVAVIFLAATVGKSDTRWAFLSQNWRHLTGSGKFRNQKVVKKVVKSSEDNGTIKVAVIFLAATVGKRNTRWVFEGKNWRHLTGSGKFRNLKIVKKIVKLSEDNGAVIFLATTVEKAIHVGHFWAKSDGNLPDMEN